MVSRVLEFNEKFMAHSNFQNTLTINRDSSLFINIIKTCDFIDEGRRSSDDKILDGID